MKASMLTLSGEGWSAFALLSGQFITPEKRITFKDAITYGNGDTCYDAKFIPQNWKQCFIFPRLKTTWEESTVVCIKTQNKYSWWFFSRWNIWRWIYYINICKKKM